MSKLDLKKIKVVSFDVFNTLFDARSYHSTACELILKKLNTIEKISPKEFHRKWDELIAKGWEELNDVDRAFLPQRIFFKNTLIDLFETYNLSGDPEESIEIWYNLLENIELFEEVPSVLDAMKDKGYTQIILSNIDNDFLFSRLSKFKLKKHFDYIFTSENLKSYKPNPIIFKKVVKHLQLKPEEIVHIGDSQSADVLGAKKAGMYAIYVNRKNRNLDSSIPKPDFMVKNLRDLLDIL
ncbi:MAG: HAD-IA family hydrolase [Candidatus Lokiarchaeota archaeon]|nr:HAD-IA family hydrolase [Candidatus Lokiarchaeota archaeon]